MRVIAIMVRNRSETIGGTKRANCEVGYGGATADTCATRWMIGLTIGAMVNRDGCDNSNRRCFESDNRCDGDGCDWDNWDK